MKTQLNYYYPGSPELESSKEGVQTGRKRKRVCPRGQNLRVNVGERGGRNNRRPRSLWELIWLEEELVNFTF